MDNPTVGDVIGGRKTIIKNYPMLPSGLSNPIKIQGARYEKLPSALQHKMTFAMSLSEMNTGGGLTFPFSKLNNQKIILSFVPAALEDEQAINSSLPEGEISDIDNIPTKLTSSIRVIPELKINDEIVLIGNSMSLGEEVDLVFKMAMPGYGSWVKHSPVVAGSYLSIASVGGNVSPSKIRELKTKMEITKNLIENQETSPFSSISQDRLLGDIFYSGTLGYFSQFNAILKIANNSANSYSSLLPSFGTFGYEPEVSYFFGLPKSIENGIAAMDLDSVTYTVASGDGNAEARLKTAFQFGVLSSILEHVIPEQLFSTPESPIEALSGVKAIQKASAEGQKIYNITPINKNRLLSHIHHNSLTMKEINDALNAGYEVITHTDAINIPGWRGAGYILFDPVTGSGAYKIGGGKNGSIMFSPAGVGHILFLLSPLFVLASLFNPAKAFAFNLLLGLAVVFLFSAEAAISMDNFEAAEYLCLIAYGLILGALMTLFSGPFKTKAFNDALATIITGALGAYFGNFCPNLLPGENNGN